MSLIRYVWLIEFYADICTRDVELRPLASVHAGFRSSEEHNNIQISLNIIGYPYDAWINVSSLDSAANLATVSDFIVTNVNEQFKCEWKPQTNKASWYHDPTDETHAFGSVRDFLKRWLLVVPAYDRPKGINT